MLAVYVREPTRYLAVAPGIVAMTLLFGNTSMAAIVITFEKRSGTLQRLLLAPVSHRTIILGKALSAGIYGIGTSLVLTVGLCILLGMSLANPAFLILGLLLGAATFSLLGLIAAVMVKEVFEAMTLLNFIRFPILFVSGVFMPLDGLPTWLRPVAMLSPLTYVVELLRFGLSGRSGFRSPWIPALVALAFVAISWLFAEATFRRNVNR
jgi:ABC-2 type transport system permease protein